MMLSRKWLRILGAINLDEIENCYIVKGCLDLTAIRF